MYLLICIGFYHNCLQEYPKKPSTLTMCFFIKMTLKLHFRVKTKNAQHCALTKLYTTERPINSQHPNIKESYLIVQIWRQILFKCDTWYWQQIGIWLKLMEGALKIHKISMHAHGKILLISPIFFCKLSCLLCICRFIHGFSTTFQVSIIGIFCYSISPNLDVCLDHIYTQLHAKQQGDLSISRGMVT